MPDAAIEALARRDRAVVLGAAMLTAALAWLYLFRLGTPSGMAMDMHAAANAGFAAWTAPQFVLTLAMWVVMMVGMMTPSAVPMLLIHARVARDAASKGSAVGSTAWFAAGYLLGWSLFAGFATCAQWALDRLALLTAGMASASVMLSAALLAAAGLYQWTPLKDLCLRHCQAPWQFVQRHGGFGRTAFASLRMGLRHSLYCIGCCWTLMLLLFVAGVMNLAWVGAIALLVLVEKVTPAGRRLAHASGVVFLLAAAWVLLAGIHHGPGAALR